MEPDPAEQKPFAPPLPQAALDKDLPRVRQLIEQGADLEAQTDAGMTALLIAAATDQYQMAEVLVLAGADIYAATPFGHTAGLFAYGRPFPEGTSHREAQLHFLELITERGFPAVPPSPKEVMEMRSLGPWPPLRDGGLQREPAGAN